MEELRQGRKGGQRGVRRTKRRHILHRNKRPTAHRQNFWVYRKEILEEVKRR